VFLNLQSLWRQLRSPVFILLFSFFGGALGYRFFYPEETWTKLFLMTAVTLSTVGYGDMLGVKHNPGAAWYSMFLIIVGMGVVLYSVSVVTAFILEGKLAELLARRYLERKVARMKDHYILCGAGQTGIHVIGEMQAMNRNFIVLESSPEKRADVQDKFPGTRILMGDATSDELLEKANIRQARGIIAALSSDKDNLFLTITARMLNPELQIISRAIDLSMRDKLIKAGANYVVSPNHAGGVRMALEITRPHVVSFVDRLLLPHDHDQHFDEFVIPDDSSLVGRTLREAAIPERTGLTIIACNDEQGDNWIFNPGADMPLQAGAVLLFIGDRKQQADLRRLFAS
jgi:voltage-gated potassium channel